MVRDLRVLPGSPAMRAVAEEALRVIRLFRAMCFVGAIPRREPESLRRAVEGLHRHDIELLVALDHLDRLGESDPGMAASIAEALLEEAAATRRAVVDALPPAEQRDVREVLPDVGACDAEVWMKVEHYRHVVPLALRDAPSLDLSDDQFVRLVAWHYPLDPFHQPRDERVRRVESRPLSREKMLEPWLVRLPVGWLRFVARLHDLPAHERKVVLARRVAARLRSRAWMTEFLRTRVGAWERTWLSAFVVTGRLRLDTLGLLREDCEVHWDWLAAPPAIGRARLRAAGLLFVGTVRGERSAAMPRDLLPSVWEALRVVAPESLESVLATARGSSEEVVRRRLEQDPAPILGPTRFRPPPS